MLLDLEFTLWVRVRCSWELVIAAVIVGAMAGSLCCRGLCRENLISAGFIPPIYSPTSPYECVGLGLSGVSHSLSQSETLVTQLKVTHAEWLYWCEDNSYISGEQVEDWGGDGERLTELCVNVGKWWPCRESRSAAWCWDQWLWMSTHWVLHKMCEKIYFNHKLM